MTERILSKLDEIIRLLTEPPMRVNFRLTGSWSRKKLGDQVADALMHSPYVVIDASGLKTISGHKPTWADR